MVRELKARVDARMVVKRMLAAFRQEKIGFFFVVGILATFVDIGLLYIFTEFLGMWYLYSAAMSYSCGMVVSYTLNKFLVFNDRRRKYMRQFAMFAAVSMSSLILNLYIIYLSVELFSLYYLTGKAIATVCAFFWNYFGQSRITFREGKIP
jgi:dolichol-phosphate mannosyltransferase